MKIIITLAIIFVISNLAFFALCYAAGKADEKAGYK